MQNEQKTKQTKEELRNSLRASIVRRLVLQRRGDMIKRKMQILSGRQSEIDKKLLALHSTRLSLDCEKNVLRADFDLLERERVELSKVRFDLTQEEAQAVLHEALSLLGEKED